MRWEDVELDLSGRRAKANASARVQASLKVFFFNDTATTEIYTLSLHDALPIYPGKSSCSGRPFAIAPRTLETTPRRSEEHTSELQSLAYLVCRLLLEKKTQ